MKITINVEEIIMLQAISQRLYSKYFDVFQKELRQGGSTLIYNEKKYNIDFMDTSEDDSVVIFACEVSDPSKRYEFTFTRG